MDNNTPEEPTIDPFDMYADQGFKLNMETSQAAGTWTGSILKDEKPVVTLELNRRNDLKAVINTDLDSDEAVGYIQGYFKDNQISTSPEHTRDRTGKRLFRSLEPGISFTLTEGLGNNKVMQVEISVLNRMLLAPRSDQQEAFMQQRLRPIAATVGALEKETPGLLINNLFANSIAAVMSPRLPM